VTGIKEVWPHLHSKLMWLFVMVTNLVIFCLCSVYVLLKLVMPMVMEPIC
jgi:hypothetical protein